MGKTCLTGSKMVGVEPFADYQFDKLEVNFNFKSKGLKKTMPRR